MAAFLLCNDAGFPTNETARLLHRDPDTVTRLTSRTDEAIGSSDAPSQLLEQVRRRLKNGATTGKQYPPLPSGPTATKLLPGLLACRLAMGLTQPDLAQQAGIARETLARLERLRRRARPQTVQVLAHALGVSEGSLTTGTQDLLVLMRRQQNRVNSEHW